MSKSYQRAKSLELVAKIQQQKSLKKTIYVECYPSKFKEEDIKKYLEFFGPVLKVELQFNEFNKLQNFCFVEFKTLESAQRAHLYFRPPSKELDKLEGSDLIGSPDRVLIKVWFKEEWISLKNEYIEFRQNVICALKSKSSETGLQSSALPEASNNKGTVCFVTGLFPKSSKSGLLKFFGNGTTISYLDYLSKETKCYIRFETPDEADAFVNLFESKTFYHTGPDQFITGANLLEDAETPRIRVSKLSGSCEEAYLTKHLPS